MFCKQCGKGILENALMCVHCGVGTGVQLAPPPTPPEPPAIPSDCSRGVYIVLALFLGGLGIHNFYAGRTKQGLTQLLLMVFLFWLIVPILIVGIWALVDAATVTEDGKGRRMA